MPRIDSRLFIKDRELTFSASTSSGPGGQHVNRVATRVTLLFDVDGSASLSATQKQRVREALATRINREGILRVVSSRHRSQRANRAATIERFIGLIAEAVRPRTRRRKTVVPRAQRRRRMDQKRRRGAQKRLRTQPEDN
ncbi:MAG: alternative ribosome rescue aminoacyl-tRNA hydrolase ArfB [Phycisphaerales bacterium]|jgi:ribosome-associated protein|nr:alternative ribosome rescue aminoacyl-tRNA hydrolase ArfB [Phycisphaerales bacterium]